jgi:hypothetical protein
MKDNKMTQANGDNSPDDPSFPETPQKADGELLPVEVLADLLGSDDFPTEVLDTEAAAKIILQRLADAGFSIVATGPAAGNIGRRAAGRHERRSEAARRG